MEGDNGGWAKPEGNKPTADCVGAIFLKPTSEGGKPLLFIKGLGKCKLKGGYVGDSSTGEPSRKNCFLQDPWDWCKLAGRGRLGIASATWGAPIEDSEVVTGRLFGTSASVLNMTYHKRINLINRHRELLNFPAFFYPKSIITVFRQSLVHHKAISMFSFA